MEASTEFVLFKREGKKCGFCHIICFESPLFADKAGLCTPLAKCAMDLALLRTKKRLLEVWGTHKDCWKSRKHAPCHETGSGCFQWRKFLQQKKIPFDWRVCFRYIRLESSTKQNIVTIAFKNIQVKFKPWFATDFLQKSILLRWWSSIKYK